MNKKETLAAIKRAGELIATGKTSYTCWALEYQRISHQKRRKYWYCLMYDKKGMETPSVPSRLSRMGLSTIYLNYREARSQRLIMLAWLHALVETGDLDTDFNWKK